MHPKSISHNKDMHMSRSFSFPNHEERVRNLGVVESTQHAHAQLSPSNDGRSVEIAVPGSLAKHHHDDALASALTPVAPILVQVERTLRAKDLGLSAIAIH